MTFADQEKWIDRTIQQKQRALQNHTFAGNTRDLIESDIVALEALKTTVNRHRSMRDAVMTVQAKPSAANFLRETP